MMRCICIITLCLMWVFPSFNAVANNTDTGIHNPLQKHISKRDLQQAQIDEKSKVFLSKKFWQETNQFQLKRLIRNGYNPNIANSKGTSALMIAALVADDPLLLKILIYAGADVERRNPTGLTPLLIAAKYNSSTLVVDALAVLSDSINTRDINGNSALMGAATRNSVDVIKTLIKRGADINAKNAAGNTPLMMAIRNNNSPAVKTLLQYKVDVFHKNKNKQDALLYTMMYSDNISNMQTLLNRGMNINTLYGKEKKSLLMIAAQHTKNPKILEYLFKKNIDIYLKDKNGKTVLDYGRKNRYVNTSREYYMLYDLINIKMNKI